MEVARALRLYCQYKMRKEMHDFIDQEELDLTFFANPGLVMGDLDVCKEGMHWIARDMNLRIEMEYLMSSGMAVNFLAHQSKQMIAEVRKTSLLNDFHEECELQEFCNRLTNHRFTTSSEILDETEKQGREIEIFCTSPALKRARDLTSNASNHRSASRSSEVLDEMYTQLLHRLIHTVKYTFLIIHREEFKQIRQTVQFSQNYFERVMDFNRAANWKEERACSREKFFRRAELNPPKLLRVIDIEATCKQGSEHVVLIDYLNDSVQQVGYTAISHTYGMDVYEVFNCPCASETCSSALKLRPRCWAKPCPHATKHQNASSGSEKHWRVVNDILKMCHILKKAGVSYAWHDGVCIAQHDEDEVNKTIMHMGWIYSKAKDTVIFLNYVGNPMAPIRNSNDVKELCCRWHTRVWTLQEAALSECRRYCVRVGASPLGDCKSLNEFEEKIALWYRHDSSTIEILEEERFFEIVKEIHTVLGYVLTNLGKEYSSAPDDVDDDVVVQTNWRLRKASAWQDCIMDLLYTLLWTCFEFPTLDRALIECSSRKSKHKGDRINSILGLAEVKHFVAHKDEKLEASTIDFFKRQGQLGLARAVFSINSDISFRDKQYITEERKHTWQPVLWISGLVSVGAHFLNLNPIEFEVLEDRRMELRSRDFNWMIWVPVRFTCKDVTNAGMAEVDSRNDGHVWNIELRYESGAFEAKLFGASVGKVYISAIKRCSREKSVLPEEIQSDVGDSSFDAQLVIVFDRSGSPILIVQGSLLDAYVFKVGLFFPINGQQQFWTLLEDSLPPTSKFIKKLIIM